MAQMTRAQMARQLQEGLNTVFGLEYDRHKEEWSDIFPVHTSKKAYEEDLLMTGFGGAHEKAEGAAVRFDSAQEGWVARYEHTTYALAFAITEEAVEDNLYLQLSAKFARALALSMRHTKEVRHADILNYAFVSTGGRVGGDGKPLIASDHPLIAGGTFSNKLAVSSDLSEEALEDAVNQLRYFVDDRGLPIVVKPRKLYIHGRQSFVAARLFGTTGRVGTALNDINALKAENSIPEGYTVNHYLTDEDAWFIKTDAPEGLKHFKRRGIRKGMETDWKTGNMMYKVSERYAAGWSDPRGMFGSEGSPVS